MVVCSQLPDRDLMVQEPNIEQPRQGPKTKQEAFEIDMASYDPREAFNRLLAPRQGPKTQREAFEDEMTSFDTKDAIDRILARNGISKDSSDKRNEIIDLGSDSEADEGEDGRTGSKADTGANQRALSVPPPVPLQIQRPQHDITSLERVERPVPSIPPRRRNNYGRRDILECTRRGDSLPPSLDSTKHEGLEMSGVRQGKKTYDEQKLAGISLACQRVQSSSPKEFPNPRKPTGSYEDEGKAIEVTRVKTRPNTSLKRLQQLNTEDNPIIVEQKRFIASVTAHVPEPKLSKAHVKDEEWHAWIRYNTKLGGSLPNYGPPEDDKAAVHMMPPTGYKKPNIAIGGPQPRNTLSFDLTSRAARSQEPEGHVSKRQRIEATIGRERATEVFDLDESEVTGSQRSGGQHTKKSGRDVSLGGSHNGSSGVAESQGVGDLVYVRSCRKKRRQHSTQPDGSSSDGQSAGSKHSSNSNYTTQGKARNPQQHQAHSNFEDATDLISDDEMDKSRLRNGQSQLAVVIPYQDPANLKPTRHKTNGKNNPTFQETGQVSKFFKSSNDNPRKENSMTTKNGTSSHHMSNDTEGKKPDYKYEEQDSYDEIQVTQDLLGDTSDASKARSTRVFHSATKDKKANVVKRNSELVKAHAPKPKKQSINPREERYRVLQVFSETRMWLVDDDYSTWSLAENAETGLYRLLDNDSVPQDFELAPRSIVKIWHDSTGRLFISRNRDTLGTKICLELENHALSKALCDNICSAGALTFPVLQSESQMEKVFFNTRKETEIAKKRTRLTHDDQPPDLQLIEAKRAARHSETGTRRQEVRIGRDMRQATDFEEDELSIEPRKTLRSRMETRSSELEESEQRKRYEIPPQNFYGKDVTLAPSLMGLNATTVPTRISTRVSTSRNQPKQRTPSPERWSEIHTDWREKWTSSILYPHEGKKKARVDFQDIQRLDEGEFLNDNLIIFYLRWLEHHLAEKRPDLVSRIYFHNTFFYTSLTKDVKGNSINYEAVKRWTSKVDLSTYDYIIIPVNEQAHWYVAIICNTPKLLVAVSSAKEEAKDDAPLEETSKEVHIHDVEESSPRPIAIPEVVSKSPANEIPSTPSLHAEDKLDIYEDQEDLGPEDNIANAEYMRDQRTGSGLVDTLDGDVEMTDAPIAVEIHETQAKSQERNPTPGKHGKRYSPQKASDPKQFCIVVLDSLGIKRSIACNKLRDYMVMEIMDKKQIEVHPPRVTTVNATKIPLQENYYDCGVFLLQYIEQFLACPDQFIGSLLRREFDYPIEWKQSEMRSKIRDTLLKLQDEQTAESSRLKKEKRKKKSAASKSQPSSTAPPATHITEPSLPSLANSNRVDCGNVREEGTKAEVLAGPKDTNQDAKSILETASKASGSHENPRSEHRTKYIGNIFKRGQKFVSHINTHDKNQSREEPIQLGRTYSTPVDVPESPQPRRKSSIIESARSSPARQLAQESAVRPHSAHSGDFSVDLVKEDLVEHPRKSKALSKSPGYVSVQQRGPAMTSESGLYATVSDSIPATATSQPPGSKRQIIPHPEMPLDRKTSPFISTMTHDDWNSISSSPEEEFVEQEPIQLDRSPRLVTKLQGRVEIPSSDKDDVEVLSDDEMLLDDENAAYQLRRESTQPSPHHRPARRLSVSPSSETQKDISSDPGSSPFKGFQGSFAKTTLGDTSPGRRQHTAASSLAPEQESPTKPAKSASPIPQRTLGSSTKRRRSASSSGRRRKSSMKVSSPVRHRMSGTNFRDAADSLIIGRHSKQ